jgi:hypothetical protein
MASAIWSPYKTVCVQICIYPRFDHALTATTRAQGIGDSDNIGDAQKDEEITKRLRDMMANHNPYARMFKKVGEYSV